MNGSSSNAPPSLEHPSPAEPIMNTSNPTLGKSLPPSSSHPPAAQTGPATSSFESSSRRPSQAGGSSASHSMPRKGQGARNQHRKQRRPGLAERGSNNLDQDDTLAELRALGNASSRRGQTSITHLLNYSMPRPFQDHSYNPRSHRRNPSWRHSSGYHAADKARYVHSNYRFVVSPEGTYSKQAEDADLYLEWSNVMQIIASTESQGASCPICLSDPVAPRMAKCGHIFCLSCLIRFMNSSDDDSKPGKVARWKSCPICDDSVYLQDVRPVRFYAGQECALPRVGDDVVLRLMARKANCTLALPREGGAEVLDSGDDVPWHFAANVLDYARIMKGTGEYMTGQFDEEIAALEHQEKEDESLFGQDPEWTQKAIKTVKADKEKIVELGSAGAVSTPGTRRSKPSSEADFNFYSAPPHLYLSPLDIRILKTKYGSFSSFPSTLLPRVEHISTGHVVDDAMRKRAKYLGHLPQGCVVSFLECDWTDIVPAETLESFKGEIERRRKRNNDKAVQEERERVQAERLEAAALRGSTGVQEPMGAIDEEHVPRMDESEFIPLASHMGTTPPDARVGFDTLASMSTSPSTQRTVWGTRAAAHTSPGLEPTLPPTSADDGWLKDEEFLGGADLAMEIEAIQLMESAQDQDQSEVPAVSVAASGSKGTGGGGGKKKKKQKITLMSTGGRRGN